MKKIFWLVFLTLFLFLGVTNLVFAQETVNVYFFWSVGCPYCAKEKVFLEKLEKENPKVKIKEFEISNNSENTQLLIKIGKALSLDVSRIPLTIVGSKYFVGYLDEKTTGEAIKEAIKGVLEGKDKDILNEKITPNQKREVVIPKSFSLPIIGELQTKDLSLPVLTLVLGLLDGFNPCAMWVLLFLISMLLGLHDRSRRWLIGITFIVASTFIYFLIMTAWLNLFLFLGFVVWIRLTIGIVALAIGGYNIREYFVNKEGGCKIVESDKRKNILEKIKEITQRKEIILALLGTILLAFAVNMIEAICSAGLPAVFTHILAINKLAFWQYYLYILLYLLVFMFDDIFIFSLAMVTLQATGIEYKYARFSHIIGGVVMLLIGLLLLFKPEILMFG